ncbi:MAG: hypothetical protein U9Q03_03315 [Patescibacteria group bacterium]|nr:hypothetical protein [Patescibacteria group bacterium]
MKRRRVIKRTTTEEIVDEYDDGCRDPEGPADPYTEDEIAISIAQIPVRFPPVYRKPPHVIGPILGRVARPFALLKK